MNNISSLKDCYGCGVCAVACPRKVISISLNANGFYVPLVVHAGCTECGLCLSVCAYNDDSVLKVDQNSQKRMLRGVKIHKCVGSVPLEGLALK